jgi:hypothetical protein
VSKDAVTVKHSYSDQSDGAKFIQKTKLELTYMEEMGSQFLFIDSDHIEIGSDRSVVSEYMSIPMNTKEDADKLIEAITQIREKLK